MREHCKQGLGRPEHHNLSFPFSGNTWFIHTHLDRPPVANLALRVEMPALPNLKPGRASESLRRCVFPPCVTRTAEASRMERHRRNVAQQFLFLAGTEMRSLSSWSRISSMAFRSTPECGASALFLVYLERPGQWDSSSADARGEEAGAQWSYNHRRRGALCKRVFPVETFFSVPKNNPKEDQTGCT